MVAIISWALCVHFPREMFWPIVQVRLEIEADSP